MSSPAMPYVGSRISLISKSEIRYEGILYVINTEESTIALQNVRSYGTEGRTKPDVPPSEEVYDFIIFRGEDIKDLTVLEGSATKPSQKAVLEDPAVVSVGPERKAPVQRPSYANDNHREQRGVTNHRDYQNDRYGSSGNNRPERQWEDRRDYRSGDQQRRPQQQTQSYQRDRRDNGYSNTRVNDRGQERGQLRGQDRPQTERAPVRNNDRPHERGNNERTYDRGQGKGGYRRPANPQPNSRGGPVGELTANENPQTKAEIGSEEFDFSSGVGKLEKPAELLKEDDTRAGYSKAKGFFDDISCDALDRAAGKEGGRFDRGGREKQRETDKETFGASALTRPFGYGGNRRFHHNRDGKGKAY